MSIERILNEEDHPQVLRMLALSGWRRAEALEKRVAFLEKLEAEKNQLKLDLEYQRTIFQKLIFSHGVETRSKDRPRWTEDEQLLLHSQSLVPAPAEETKRSLKNEGMFHAMTTEEILEEARVRALPEDITQWKEIEGLTEDSMEVTVIERQYILQKHKRKKYRYQPSKGTDKEIIVTAKGPEKLLSGCSYSIDFALSVVRDKYEYHLPLERQTRQMEALGLKGVGTKTLYNLCEAVSVHLEPVAEAIRKDILSSNLCVHMDETPWPIQGKDDDGYMWILSNQAGSLYRFEPTRSGKVADEMLGDYEGPLLSDAYNGYDRFKKKKGITLGHCWAHGRRKFFEIREIYPESEEILDWMENLFAIEREAKTYEELGVLRQEKSKPLVDKMYAWLIERKSRHLPESAFTKAVDYLLKRRKEFSAFLTDVRIPLSNNDAERTVRHAVMGRKNFYGSKTINGADTAAILYTVIESCKRVEIDPTMFIRQAILRNNRKEPQATPLQFARELRKSPPEKSMPNPEQGLRLGYDYVVFFEKPFIKFERVLLTILQTYPKSHRLFREAMIAWFGDKLWIKHHLQRRFPHPSKILFGEHHLSHAASAFFCSPFEEAAILTVDGVGEWACASYGTGLGTKIKLLKEIRFPHSLGLLYSAFTAFLGFEVNEGEYKVMGMAPFGKPRHVDKVRRLIRVDEEGGFELNIDYFSFHYSAERTFNAKFENLFGKPRDPQSLFFTETSGFPAYFGERPPNFKELAQANQDYADIAASIQKVTEEILVKMANHLQKETGLKRLCLAGGVALNSVANTKILKETSFEEIYIQPAAGDGGGALGAALYAYHMVLGKERKFVMEHAHWGEEHSAQKIERFLNENGIPHRHFGEEEGLLTEVVENLVEGKVVGWHQGRFEFGPRALGGRSILADPRRPDMKDIVNTKIKFREPFRPFAPSVLVEKASEYFSLPRLEKLYPSRFMLCVADVRETARAKIPAVTHVDGTARVQLVFRETHPRYYRLIEKFFEKTGIPVLLNTSFNLKGEPIVNTPKEAFSTFSKSGMDCLVLGNYLIEKNPG